MTLSTIYIPVLNLCYFCTKYLKCANNGKVSLTTQRISVAFSLRDYTRSCQARLIFDMIDIRLLVEAITSTPALWPIQPPVQWVPRLSPLGLNGRSVKMTTVLHLTLKLKVLGSIPHFTFNSVDNICQLGNH
jgi:hypothetical protein